MGRPRDRILGNTGAGGKEAGDEVHFVTRRGDDDVAGFDPRNGADVGNILVRRKTGAGWEDVTYFVDFAFAFHAFSPNAPIHDQ